MAATNEKKHWQNFYVKSGKFCTLNKDNEIDGEYDTITGSLSSVSVYIGQSKGEDKEFLRIVLDDGETMQVVRVGANTTFHRMFAGYLPYIQAEQPIKLQASPGGDNELVSGCYVKVYSGGGEWEKCQYDSLREKYGDDDDAANDHAREAVLTHDAFKVYTPKVKGASTHEAPDQHRFKFMELCTSLGWPSFGNWPQLYMQWFRQVWDGMEAKGAQVPNPRPATVDAMKDDHFLDFIDLIKKHRDKFVLKENWPKPLLAVDEYDPFADE